MSLAGLVRQVGLVRPVGLVSLADNRRAHLPDPTYLTHLPT